MWNLILASTLAMAATPVQVETLDGERVTGELQNWTASQLTVQTAEGEKSVPTARLAVVKPLKTDTLEVPAADVHLELIDGSKLEAAEFTVVDGKASVKLNTGLAMEAPVKLISAVQLKEFETQELHKQWEQIRQSKPAGDLVVVRKGEALDFLEGILGKITAETVDFKLEGDDLTVKRTKLDGIIYFKNQLPSFPELKSIVSTRGGSKIKVQQLTLEGPDKLKLVSLAGVELTVPWSEIAKLDFAAGSVTYLSDLKPETSTRMTFFPLPEKLPLLSKYGQPAFDRALEGGPLRFIPEVGGEARPMEFERGIALRSKTELVYRLPDKFRRLRALAFMDSRIQARTDASLKIWGDDRVLLDQVISGRKAPVEIDLDIADVRRIRILVDYGAGTDIGDQLDLAEARVTK